MGADNHLLEIICALSDARVEFIVGGGVASVLHGVERMTLDIDIALRFDRPNVDRFFAVMLTMGIRPLVPVTAQSLASRKIVEALVMEKDAIVINFVDPDRPFRHVDVFLRKDLSYESLLPHSQKKPIAGRSVHVVTVTKLLQIKRAIKPPRAKDKIDIVELTRIAKGASK